MKITFEISNEYLQDIMPFLTRQSAGHIKIAKECIKKAFWKPIEGSMTSGCEFTAWALEIYLREMKSEYIRLKEAELGRKMETEDFVELLNKNKQ